MSSFFPSATTIIAKALAANGTNEAAQLYAAAGTQFSQLNFFEQWWAAWYLWIADPTIATGLMSFVMHEVGVSLVSERESALTHGPDGLLWSGYPLVHYRCHTLF